MIRIIPRLDIKGPNLVKGIHLEGLRVLGDPHLFANYYYENGADELVFQDVVASLFDRNSLHEIISNTAKNIFVPITIGGGLRNIEDIKMVLRAGADKVSLNTAAIKDPNFIKEASTKFGSSTIVIAIEAIKQQNGNYFAFIDNGREETGIEVIEWAKKAESLGAGELMITSVDRDGTGTGFDIELLNKVVNAVSIPIIAHGGASSLENIYEAATTGVNGLAIASIFHYGVIEKIDMRKSIFNEGNISFLQSGKTFGKIDAVSISEVKEYLSSRNIKVRP